jgi:hypothetical protein
MNYFASRTLPLTLLVFAFSLAGCGAASEQEDASNASAELASCPSGDFAAHALSDTTAWFLSGSAASSYTISLDKSHAVLGQPPLTIQSLSGDAPAGKFGTAMNTVDAVPFRGKTLRFSADVIGRASNGWGGLWMRIDDAAGRALAFDNMENRPLKGDVAYMKHEVVLDVPQNASSINFGVLLDGAGALSVADAAFEIVDWHQGPGPFEQDPASWLVTGAAPADYVMATDATASRCGRPSARISSRVKQPADFGAVAQSLDAYSYRGKRVRLSGFAKANTTGWAGLWMRVDAADGKVLSFDNMQNRPLTVTGGWTPVSVVLDVPANSAEIVFGLLLDGAGDAWMNSVTVDIVDPSVPVTNKL